MRHFTIAILLTLSACGGINNKQQFFADTENANKYTELQTKYEKSPDCEKLGQLYEFSTVPSPTKNDLAQILPLFGLSTKDSSNIDKVYKINYSIIDKYNCTDNADVLTNEYKQFCHTKNRHNKYTRRKCYKYLSEAISINRPQYVSIDKQGLKNNLETKIKNMFPPLPKDSQYLLDDFTASELITANNTVLGTYDGNCDAPCYDSHCYELCDSSTNIVTKLNAAMTLYDRCMHDHNYIPGGVIVLYTFYHQPECACYAHETYKNVNYKNLIYIYEKREIPKSKQSEFNQIMKKCEQKIKQQKIKAEKDRYGETSRPKNTNNNVFIESIDNAAWATQQINKEINKMRNK